MSDPFEVLNLPATANEQAIRARYLELVRKFPPESAPDQFAEIRAAYDELSDPRQQLRRTLFQPSEDALSAIIADVSTTSRARRIPTDDLLSMGRDAC